MIVMMPTEVESIMGYNKLNPLEKEVLIKLYRNNPDVKLPDFCRANNVSDAAFRTWLRKYDAEGIEGLYRSKTIPSLLPEGVDETVENLKRELIKARIECERLKKNYTQTLDEDGNQTGYERLYEKSTKS